MRPLSLATRLTLFFGVAAAVVFPIFGWVISREMEDHFAEGDTAELTIIANAVENALLSVRSSGDLASVERRFDDILIGHHSASLYIGRNSGQTLYTSDPHLDLRALADRSGVQGSDTVGLWNDENETYRVLVRQIGGDRSEFRDIHTIVVATPIDYHLVFLASFRRTLWLMIGSSIVLMSLMGWLAARRGHAPLREIVGRLRLVTTKERAQSIPPDSVPRELADLAVSFNEMLRRVDDAFQRLANFNADIAHELRTPITNLMTQTQVALSRARTIDEYREILYSNMEEYERMAQMVADMLYLAQADSGTTKRESLEVDLGAAVRGLFDYYEGWAEERGVTLKLTGTVRVDGDRLMLQRALGNLISNAIRHAPAGSAVHVVLEPADEGGARIAVENSGAEIPAEHLPKLFDRFYRVDASRQRSGEGAGLGLAIVKSIVDAHDGKIGVTSANGRTVFEIVLP